MRCQYCDNQCIKKGSRNKKQRYKCKTCAKYQIKEYAYKLYNSLDDINIIALNSESTSISSMSRLLGYSRQTIIRRIKTLAKKVVRPVLYERNQVYEVDEMWTYIGANNPQN